jgi:hypothetical protein
VTNPVLLTVAASVFDELQVTDLLVASAGRTVSVSCCKPPVVIVAVVGLTLTDVTAIGVTVISLVAVKPPSTVVTVIVAEPTPTAVTRPVVLTVATKISDELQVTDLSVAPDGSTVSVSC